MSAGEYGGGAYGGGRIGRLTDGAPIDSSSPIADSRVSFLG